MMLSSVDLPQPEAPTMQAKCASGISSETRSIACTRPLRVSNIIETSETEIELIARRAPSTGRGANRASERAHR
jgi:hypothetical protein